MREVLSERPKTLLHGSLHPQRVLQKPKEKNTEHFEALLKQQREERHQRREERRKLRAAAKERRRLAKKRVKKMERRKMRQKEKVARVWKKGYNSSSDDSEEDEESDDSSVSSDESTCSSQSVLTKSTHSSQPVSDAESDVEQDDNSVHDNDGEDNEDDDDDDDHNGDADTPAIKVVGEDLDFGEGVDTTEKAKGVVVDEELVVVPPFRFVFDDWSAYCAGPSGLDIGQVMHIRMSECMTFLLSVL